MSVLPLRIGAIEPISPTLKKLRLEPADGGLLPTAPPGAHIMLTLESGSGRCRNAYSVVSPTDQRGHYEVMVRRVAASRGGSAFIHDGLCQGDVIVGSAPNNAFPLQSRARKHLLIGGGIGITPFLSYLPALRAAQQRLELHLVSGIADVPVMEALLAPFAAHDTAVHAGRAALDVAGVLARQPLGTHVYVCGPMSLMETVQREAARLGWPASKVHRESFGPSGGDPFTIRLGRSGREISVQGDQSMLEALEAADVAAPSLCRGGACGECVTGVLEGVPDHRDNFLTADERASGALVMPCISRSLTRVLVLDL